MMLVWLVPLCLAVAVLGTRTALLYHKFTGGNQMGRDWWMLIPLAWLPIFCLVLSTWVQQG